MKRIFIYLAVILLSGCATVHYQERPFKSVISKYITIDNFCKSHNFKYSFNTLDDIVRIYSFDKDIRLLLNSPVCYIGGRYLYLKITPIYIRGTIYIPKELKNIVSTAKPPFLKPGFIIKTVVIDPGHGGKDPGAISPWGLKEKDINLKVALYLKSDLEKKGIKVILTRYRDIYLTLRRRVLIAKKYNADLFVSIHANANHSRRLKGTEIYYLSPARFHPKKRAGELAKGKDFGSISKSKKETLWRAVLNKNYALSVDFSRFTYKTLKNLGFNVKFPKKAPFYVLRNAYVPSILIEMGYLTNRYEEKSLRNKYRQMEIAEAISLGIVSFSNKYAKLAKKN